MPKIQYRDCNFKGERLAIIDQANDIIATYRALGSAISDGRDAGMIDWDAIEDRGRGVSQWLM